MFALVGAGGLLGALIAGWLRAAVSPRAALVGESWLLAAIIPLLFAAHGRGVAVCAANAGAILVADQNGAIWRSVNGSSHWVRVAPGLGPIEQYAGWPSQLSCRGQNAVELSQAFCEAACGGGMLSRVRQSTDDGRAWRTIATQHIGAGPTATRPASVPNALLEAAPVGVRSACLAGGYQDGQPPHIGIWCTAPGSASYRRGTIPNLPFPGEATSVVGQGIDFVNAKVGWLMLDSIAGTHIGGPAGDRAKTEILTTHNGGQTWQPAYVSPTYRATICPSSGPTATCWRNPLG